MTASKTEIDGDPWVAKWTDAAGVEHNLYESDVAVLRAAAAGRVYTDNRFAKWVFVDHSRCTVRDQVNKTWRRLVELGILVAGEPEEHGPARPEFSSCGTGRVETPYRLVDSAAEAMLAAVR